VLKRKRDPHKAATDATQDIADAITLVRHLGGRLDDMPGGYRVVAALMELRDAAGQVVTCQTLK
jgi:hypothetical protein